MKPNTENDPDFACRPCSKTTSVRTRWPLVLLAVTATLTLVFATSTRSGPAPLRNSMPWLRPSRVALSQPVPRRAINLTNSQPSDHFVMMADPSNDAEMVHRVPEGFDDAMVVRARGRRPRIVLAWCRNSFSPSHSLERNQRIRLPPKLRGRRLRACLRILTGGFQKLLQSTSVIRPLVSPPAALFGRSKSLRFQLLSSES